MGAEMLERANASTEKIGWDLANTNGVVILCDGSVMPGCPAPAGQLLMPA